MQTNDVRIIAHRAGNNIFSIKTAVADGADFVELDLHLSKDRVLVVQYLPYVSDGKSNYYIEDYTASELEPYGVLLFEQVLESIKDKNVKLLADIKKGKHFYTNIPDVITDLISKYDMEKKVEVLSFDHKCITDIRNRNSKIKAGIMYVARLAHFKEYLNICKPSFVEICSDYLDEESVMIAQNMGVGVYGWGSDEKEILQYYRSIGMYAVTVNDVKNAVRILKG